MFQPKLSHGTELSKHRETLSQSSDCSRLCQTKRVFKTKPKPNSSASSPSRGCDISTMDMTHQHNDTSVRYTRTGRPSRAQKGLPVHQCDDCKNIYTRAEHLRRHRSRHDCRHLKCNVGSCKRRFQTVDLLEIHQKEHRQQSEGGRASSETFTSTSPVTPHSNDLTHSIDGDDTLLPESSSPPGHGRPISYTFAPSEMLPEAAASSLDSWPIASATFQSPIQPTIPNLYATFSHPSVSASDLHPYSQQQRQPPFPSSSRCEQQYGCSPPSESNTSFTWNAIEGRSHSTFSSCPSEFMSMPHQYGFTFWNDKSLTDPSRHRDC